MVFFNTPSQNTVHNGTNYVVNQGSKLHFANFTLAICRCFHQFWSMYVTSMYCLVEYSSWQFWGSSEHDIRVSWGLFCPEMSHTVTWIVATAPMMRWRLATTMIARIVVAATVVEKIVLKGGVDFLFYHAFLLRSLALTGTESTWKKWQTKGMHWKGGRDKGSEGLEVSCFGGVKRVVSNIECE